MASSARSCSVGAQSVRYTPRGKVAVAGVGTGVGVFVGAMVGVGGGSGVEVAVGAMVGVGVADGVGLGASEHPVRSAARSSAPAHNNPSAMDFDIITFLSARFSATVPSTVAFRMTRRKVRLYLLRGVHLYPSNKVRLNLASVVERRTLFALVEA